MPFQTHRPTQTLLIPQKRPLLAPVKPTINVVQHQHHTSPENSLPNTTTTITTITPQKEERKEEELQPTEYDFARMPQPFLDPRLWENIKSVDSLYSSSLSASSFSTAAFSGAEAEAASSSSIRERRGMNEKEAEEEDRRKRAREAEYGGMAVRGRSGVRGRRDR